MRTRIIAGIVSVVLLCQGRQVAVAETAPGGRVDLRLDGNSLTIRQAFDVLDAKSARVTLDPRARTGMETDRDGALAALRDQHVYGWNQALGPLKDISLSDPRVQDRFQRNILLSHAAGVGPELPDRVVRLALVIKANQMARGQEGVRPALAERLLALVNAGVTPVMRAFGSLGTGDLQPQAAAGLVAVGGPAPARYNGREVPARQALAKAGLLPVTFPLQQGEALPIISGSTVVAALLLDAAHRATALADQAEGAYAMFLDVTRAEQNNLDQRTHDERGIPEQSGVVRRIGALVAGSRWMTDDGRRRIQPKAGPRVQDSVAVRAAPHIMGTFRHAIDDAENILLGEINTSTSNPLVFKRTGGAGGYEFVSGGNWDGAMMGHTADTLNADVADLGVLSETLSARLLSDKWSYGLPRNLAGGEPGLNSGMVQVESVATSLIPEMQVRAFPASVLSRPAKDGQEDHNTMAMASVRDLAENLDRLEPVLAVQFLMCAQGIDLIRPEMSGLPMGAGTGRLLTAIRKTVKFRKADHYMTPDLQKAIRLVRGGELLDAMRGGPAAAAA